MPTLDTHAHPETLSYDQQEVAEIASQASGRPPSLPEDMVSAISAPNSDSGIETGLEAPFTSLAYPVGLNDHPALCRPTETLLILKETEALFAGGAYEVKDSEGQVIIKVNPHRLSLHESKDIESADGRKLFVLKTKLASLRRTYEGESPDGKHLFEIGTSSSGMAACTFSNMCLGKDVASQSTSSQLSILLRGSFHQGNGNLVVKSSDDDDEIVVAQIRNSLVERCTVVTDSQTHFVKVAAHVDLALVGTICLCLSQLRE